MLMEMPQVGPFELKMKLSRRIFSDERGFERHGEIFENTQQKIRNFDLKNLAQKYWMTFRGKTVSLRGHG